MVFVYLDSAIYTVNFWIDHYLGVYKEIYEVL